jgi:hypothetical protein
MRRKNFLKRGLSTVLPHNFSDRILKQYRQILNGNEDLAKALTAADNATLDRNSIINGSFRVGE